MHLYGSVSRDSKKLVCAIHHNINVFLCSSLFLSYLFSVSLHETLKCLNVCHQQLQSARVEHMAARSTQIFAVRRRHMSVCHRGTRTHNYTSAANRDTGLTHVASAAAKNMSFSYRKQLARPPVQSILWSSYCWQESRVVARKLHNAAWFRIHPLTLRLLFTLLTLRLLLVYTWTRTCLCNWVINSLLSTPPVWPVSHLGFQDDPLEADRCCFATR